MGKRLYVSGIPYQTTEDDLKDAFAKAGEVVESTIITERFSGRSKGFGFVEMGTEEEAQKAIEMWNDQELDGRRLRVNEAQPRREDAAV